jgi:hypothetical protein
MAGFLNGRPLATMRSMENQERLRHLESQRRDVLGMATVAKARYLALNGEVSSTPAAIERARAEWQNLEARKVAVAFQILRLQELTQEPLEH